MKNSKMSTGKRIAIATLVPIITFGVVFAVVMAIRGNDDLSANAAPPAPVGEPSGVKIGETLKAENFEFTILETKAEETLLNEVGVTYTAAEGHKYVVIVLNAKNTTDATQNVMNVGFNSYVDDVKVGTQPIVGEIGGYMPLLGAVSPQKNFEGYAVWELPLEWKTFEFSYIDAISGKDSESFIITAADVA